MNKKIYSLIILVVALLLIFFLYFFYKGQVNAPAAPAIKDTNNYGTTTISIGQSTIFAEIADTPALRELGLGNRTSLGENNGMIFVFDHPDKYGFWMKDTLIPLDMIWIDQNKNIVDIKSDIATSTYPEVFYPSQNALYVLEVNAGFAQKAQIKIDEHVNF